MHVAAVSGSHSRDLQTSLPGCPRGNTPGTVIWLSGLADYRPKVALKATDGGVLGRTRRFAWWAACTSIACSFALTVPLALAPAASFSAAVTAGVPASLSDDVAAAKKQLAAASNLVQDADDAADAANAKMPAANQALARADNAVTVAEQAVVAANEAVAVAKQAHSEAAVKVAAAEAAVKAQLQQVARAQRKMDDLKDQIAAVARRIYISGSEYAELTILLDTRDPSQFAEQLVALKRVSRANAELFSAMIERQAALAAALVTLRDLQAATAAREQEAQDRADDAAARARDVIARAQDVRAARDAAQARKQYIANLIASREAKRAEALAHRKQLKATYEALQAKLLAQSGAVMTWGTRRDPQQAIAWGMKFVGSGAEYDGLCLGFVDDAYDPIGGHSRRMPSAIEQWYRAKAAGKAHPGGRTPAIGAQVFWDIPGYPYGHIAIWAGGGMVLTTSAFGGTRVGLRTLVSMESSLGRSLGWAEPYYA